MWRSVQKFFAIWMTIFSTIGTVMIWYTEPPPHDEQRGNTDHAAKHFFADVERPLLTSRCTRQLQLWTDKHIHPFSTHAFTFTCPRVQCRAVVVADMNVSTTHVSDAVVIFPQSNWTWETMVNERVRGQKWVFFSRESPLSKQSVIPPKEFYDRSYDYIMSYRRGAHFPVFGEYDGKKPQVSESDERNWAMNKTGLIVAFPGECGRGATWERDKLVNELKAKLTVTMSGECDGKEICGKLQDCVDRLKPFKFSLALENCNCRDYITEKFFVSLASDTLPIVGGAPRVDYERVAPPNSFIHVEDYSTAEELADYVRFLHNNDFLYNRYFDWKKEGSVVGVKTRESDVFKMDSLCKVFERMHQDELKEGIGISTKPKVLDWQQWWTRSCLL